ncbi:MAG: ComEC/Rec2 family competence protein [Clostridium sp.]
MIYLKKLNIKLFFIILCLILCTNATSCFSSVPSLNPNELRVHYIDVGQGDSQLIQFNNKTMLIDAGPDDKSSYILKYLRSNNVKTIDYIIATHPHEDHIGSMDEILNKFKVHRFYMPKVTEDSKSFDDMTIALDNSNAKVLEAKSGVNFNLDNEVTANILSPNSSNYEDLNNYSAVVKLNFKNTSFLFTGDAEELSENEILNTDYNICSQVLKVGHHGSNSSTSLEFLQGVNPAMAIISCGVGNSYGHPTEEILNRLKDLKIKTLRTDKEGTIIISSDGSNIYKLK